ncbi:efflux transporter outer membrane subunit [Rugamonas sp.]|uniref:efflux transporter outer membrane subunit n=1 Tax=Rugamonas sp. TaxID=1926287 RepID=UPI0025EC843E|nr:efflux transporter outer membrane subunit [Rugamonas sp.]
MTKLTPLAQACLAAIALSLAGCAHIPQDRDALAQRDVASARLSSDIKLAHEGWPEAQWWTVYHDAQLNALIARALAAGPTLEVAAAHIGAARSALSRTTADLGIDADLAAGVNRQRYSATGLFPAPIGGAYYTEETIRLEARYNFDWWGKNRAQIAASAGEVQARRAEYAQAEQALAAAIAQSYFTLQGDWARLANLDQLTRTQTALIQDQVQRIAHGLADADAQRQAETELSLMNKQRALLAADAAHEREALRALVGADGDADAGAGADDQLLANLKPQPLVDAPHALPARLGIELLARRPDLQAARWRVEASISGIDAAKAAFYPDLNLTAAVGLDSTSIDHLLQSASRTVFAGPTLTLPLFDSKRLSAQLDTARSARNQAIAEYNQGVIDAVRDVAQSGAQLQGIENQIAQQDAASAGTRAQLQSARARLDHGLADHATVLQRQAALLKQQDAALALQTMEQLAEVALTNALGGGYRIDDHTVSQNSN